MKIPAITIALFFAAWHTVAQKPHLVVPIRHFEKITSAQFLGEGESVSTSSPDGTSIYWDLEGHEIERPTSGESSVSFSWVFSPDGKTMLNINPGRDTINLIKDPWNSRQLLQTFITAHTIKMAFSPDGKIVLTGSAEGMIKQWDLSGQLLSSFQLQENNITGMDFSPKGNAALTVNEAGVVNMWDLSGNLLQTFIGHADHPWDVACSPDGKEIFVGGNHGVKRWDLTGRGLQHFTEHRSPVTQVALLPDGKTLLTGSLDKTVRLTRLTGQQIQTYPGLDSSIFAEVVVSEDGKKVLCSGENNTANLWDVQTGQLIHTFKELTARLSYASFSPDGKTLLTGCEDHSVMLWDMSGNVLQTFVGINEVVTFSPNGKLLLAGGDTGAPKIYDLSGRELQDLGAGLESFERHQGSIEPFCFSPDGKSVLTTGWDDSNIKHWNLSGGLLNTLEGHGKLVNSAVFLPPNGRIVVSASDDYTLKIWDASSANELATLVAVDSTDWVVTTPSGLFDASPSAMKLLYFLVYEDFIELTEQAPFVYRKRKWEFIELDQLKERYFEPGLLAKIMGLSDEPIRDVAVFDSVPLYPVVRLQLDTMQNKLKIQLSPRNGGLGKVSVFIGDKEIIEDANPPKIKGIEKSRDSLISIELDKYARYFLTDTLNTISVRAYNEAGWLKSAAKSVEYRPVFARKRGDDTRNGGIQEPKPMMNRQPNLHILVVGTSDYAGDKLDLQYPDKDARDIAHALEQIGKQLFPLKKGKVFVHLLSTDTLYTSPTKSNIKAAFEEIKNQSKAEDILIAYFSGHGITYGDADQALFYYLTREIGDFNLSDPGTREKRCISSVELSKWIKSDYSKKQVLILDACNSGKMVESLSGGQKALSSSQILAFDRMKDRTGLFILAGSAADKVSYEASQYAQGLLTFSLLEGINGLAHPNSNLVDVMELFQYACNRVPQLAKDIGGIQTPMLLGPSKGSFHIGEKNDSVQIKLADPKPVFIRNVFLDQTFGDELNLVGALEDVLQRSNTKGAETDMVYADVREYENGYSIRGTYAIKKPNVEVNASLFKGKKLQGTFKVTWNKDDVPGLANKIIEKAFSLIKS